MTRYLKVYLKEETRQKHWMPVERPHTPKPSGVTPLAGQYNLVWRAIGIKLWVWVLPLLLSGNVTLGKFFNNSKPQRLHPWSGDTNSTHLLKLSIWYNNQKKKKNNTICQGESSIRSLHAHAMPAMCQALGSELEAPLPFCLLSWISSKCDILVENWTGNYSQRCKGKFPTIFWVS